ncbi:MAG TPA: hypothetical protein VNV87_00145 [Acidimicrobiales bacterium]|nr:hypothetical protein [Acidimicrobiales bacterium]
MATTATSIWGSTRRRSATVVAAILVVASLGAVGAQSASAAQKNGSSCTSYKAGSNGVIRTFCGGKVVITLTTGAGTSTIKGGTCGVSGGYFTVNSGVVIDSSFKGAKPNYFGLDVPPKATTFTNAILTYTVNGVGGAVTQNSGTVTANHKSGTFTGTDLTGTAVSGSFSC